MSDTHPPAQPYWFVVRVGKDELVRFKSAARRNGATVTCEHYHGTEKEAQTCLDKCIARAASRRAKRHHHQGRSL